MKKTPIESWLFRKIDYEGIPERGAREVEAYQLKKIQESLQYVKQNSLFYKKHLSHIDAESIRALEDFRTVPFTTSQHIQENPIQFVCVSQDEIERIVTLKTSGTTGQPKRLYFTKKDQKLIKDFFAAGMSTLVKAGDRVLILMLGEQPGSVGDLLKKALHDINVESHVYGFVDDPERVLSLIKKVSCNCLVGIPVQVLSLLRVQKEESLPIKRCLLSGDYAPEALIRAIESQWNSSVFTHYGMTEMGLGGGVECEAKDGYHLRESDLYFEIVHPYTGNPVTEGEWGEVVFTTLTREGMPLIRYRTGDISRFIPEPCSCGSYLKRIDKIKGRWEDLVQVDENQFLSIGEIDEVLFKFREVIDYDACLKISDNVKELQIHVKSETENFHSLKMDIENELIHIPVICRGILNKKMVLPQIMRRDESKKTQSHIIKRKIIICEG